MGASATTTPTAAAITTTTTTTTPVIPAPMYDEEKNEMGGHGHANSSIGKIEIKMKILHEGEVNRARYMPQNHFIVASRGPENEVYIFDLRKHESLPTSKSVFSPQGVCIGHTKEGYAMSWNQHHQGQLLTGSEDRTVMLWDVSQIIGTRSEPGTQIHPKYKFLIHKDVVEDVDWRDANVFGSVGDDKIIALWDTRMAEKNNNKPIHLIQDAHTQDIHTIAFNPHNNHVFATGSADKTIALWDIRKIQNNDQKSINQHQRMHTLVSGHTESIYKIEWSPHNETILASCSSDRRVAIWDLERIGKEQDVEDAEDGPPELLFIHGGHTSKVSDFSWSTQHEWIVASVAEDNVLQVWQPSEEIYRGDDDVDLDDEDDVENNANNSNPKQDGMLGDDDLE